MDHDVCMQSSSQFHVANKVTLKCTETTPKSIGICQFVQLNWRPTFIDF